MRNLIIAGAVVAAGAVGYLVSQQGGETSVMQPADHPLAYVPADTVFFSGQLEPYPVKDYLQSVTYTQTQVPDDFLEELDDDPNPKNRFIGSLVRSYFEASRSAESFLNTFGLPEQMRMLVYAVGFIPVLRYEVADETRLWALLDKAEQESGFSHQTRSIGELNYRVYPFENSDNGEKFELLVAFHEGWATWSFNTHLNDAQTEAVVLAQSKPKASLEQSGTLDEIAKNHGFIKTSLSYLDHQGVVTALTTEKGNALAQMLTQVLEREGKTDDFAELRTPECQAEMGAIAANWPRTVLGFRDGKDIQISAERSYMKMSMVVESHNQTVLDALNAVQGYLPDYLNGDQVFSMGFGIDANKLSSSMSSIWSNMLEPAYQCKPLMEMQEGLKASNPAALAMFTGMAQGVKGIGMGVQSFALNLNGPEPQLDDLQGVITLSADQPEVIFNMAKAFAPPLAGIQVPNDGSAVDLATVMPIPPELNIRPMLAVKGKHLVIYNGEKGAAIADQLADEEPISNGILGLSIDYKKLLAPLVPVLEQAAADPAVTEQLEVLKHMDMRIKMAMDMNPQGIQLTSEADIKAAPKGETVSR